MYSGICGFGFYFPKFRITSEEIANTWNKDFQNLVESLKIKEKSIASRDEDTVTMGFEASRMALTKFGINISQISTVFLGTETPSYAVNPSSTILASFLGLSTDILALDTQFACRAATGALVASLKLNLDKDKYGLVVASDKANSKPKDILEYSAGSGATAWVIGNNKPILKVIETHSVSSDTPDFWRRSSDHFPSHAGRFTGKPAYFQHVTQASNELLKKTKTKPEDYDFAVFHMPNGKFPRQAAKILGFEASQIKDSLVVENLGNSYASSALMGLASVLTKAQPGQKIFFCSYGSGAGSDAIAFETTIEINKIKLNFQKMLETKEYVNYQTYRQLADIY